MPEVRPQRARTLPPRSESRIRAAQAPVQVRPPIHNASDGREREARANQGQAPTTDDFIATFSEAFPGLVVAHHDRGQCVKGVCPTCGQPPRLSDPQRDRYFAMIGNLLQHPKLKHLTKPQLDLYFRDKFLDWEEIELPNKKVIRQQPSLSRVKGPNIQTMSEYMDKITQWCAEVGVWEVE